MMMRLRKNDFSREGERLNFYLFSKEISISFIKISILEGLCLLSNL